MSFTRSFIRSLVHHNWHENVPSTLDELHIHRILRLLLAHRSSQQIIKHRRQLPIKQIHYLDIIIQYAPRMVKFLLLILFLNTFGESCKRFGETEIFSVNEISFSRSSSDKVKTFYLFIEHP